MSQMTLMLIVLIGTLLICIFSRVPVFLSIAISAIVFAFCFPRTMPFEILAQGLVQGMNSFSFAGIAFFFFMGEIMSAGGIAERMIDFFRTAVGWVRGGLSHVNVLTSMMFAGTSGSAMTDTVTTCNMLVPTMIKNGYPAEYSVAVTIATSTVGPIIPPSSALILMALYTQSNVRNCLLGGLVPGICMGLFMLTVSIIQSRRRQFPKDNWQGLKALWLSFKRNFFALMMPVLIVICLTKGIGTVNEVGAISVLYAIIVSCLIYKDLDFKGLLKACFSAAKSSAKLLCIICSAGIFTWIIGTIGLQSYLTRVLSPFIQHPTLLLMMCALIFFIAGMIVDHTIIQVIIAPLLAPLIRSAGIDMIQYCVMTVIVATMGMVTPPVGVLIYVGSSIGKTSPVKVIKELVPFIISLVLFVVVMILFPQMTTWFPYTFS